MNEATRKEMTFECEMNQYMKAYYVMCGYEYDFRGDKQKDVILYSDNEKILVEHKFRKVEYNDILVEIVQDLKTNASGWLYECEADDLHYVICKEAEGNMRPIYFYDIKFKLFRNWLFEWLMQNKGHYRTSNKGWGITLNLAVPIKTIPNDLIKKLDVQV